MTDGPVTHAEMTERIKQARPVRMWYVFLVGFVSVLIAFLMTLIFISQVSQSRKAETCDVISAQLDVFKETPPTTPTGQRVQQAWQRMYNSLNCSKVRRS